MEAVREGMCLFRYSRCRALVQGPNEKGACINLKPPSAGHAGA